MMANTILEYLVGTGFCEIGSSKKKLMLDFVEGFDERVMHWYRGSRVIEMWYVHLWGAVSLSLGDGMRASCLQFIGPYLFRSKL